MKHCVESETKNERETRIFLLLLLLLTIPNDDDQNGCARAQSKATDVVFSPLILSSHHHQIYGFFVFPFFSRRALTPLTYLGEASNIFQTFFHRMNGGFDRTKKCIRRGFVSSSSSSSGSRRPCPLAADLLTWYRWWCWWWNRFWSWMMCSEESFRSWRTNGFQLTNRRARWTIQRRRMMFIVNVLIEFVDVRRHLARAIVKRRTIDAVPTPLTIENDRWKRRLTFLPTIVPRSMRWIGDIVVFVFVRRWRIEEEIGSVHGAFPWRSMCHECHRIGSMIRIEMSRWWRSTSRRFEERKRSGEKIIVITWWFDERYLVLKSLMIRICCSFICPRIDFLQNTINFFRNCFIRW